MVEELKDRGMAKGVRFRDFYFQEKMLEEPQTGQSAPTEMGQRKWVKTKCLIGSLLFGSRYAIEAGLKAQSVHGR